METENGPRYVLADFGLTVPYSSDDMKNPEEVSYIIEVSPPEHDSYLERLGPASPESDIWALGVTFLDLVIKQMLGSEVNYKKFTSQSDDSKMCWRLLLKVGNCISGNTFTLEQLVEKKNSHVPVWSLFQSLIEKNKSFGESAEDYRTLASMLEEMLMWNSKDRVKISSNVSRLSPLIVPYATMSNSVSAAFEKVMIHIIEISRSVTIYRESDAECIITRHFDVRNALAMTYDCVMRCGNSFWEQSSGHESIIYTLSYLATTCANLDISWEVVKAFFPNPTIDLYKPINECLEALNGIMTHRDQHSIFFVIEFMNEMEAVKLLARSIESGVPIVNYHDEAFSLPVRRRIDFFDEMNLKITEKMSVLEDNEEKDKIALIVFEELEALYEEKGRQSN